MSKYYPSELINGILCCCPTKSLLRFKSVSKSWRSLIEDQCFIKSCLKRSTETNTNLGLYINNYRTLYWVALDSLDHTIQLDCPFNPYDYMTMVGSCNGWVCFVNDNADHIVLSNMSTKEYHKVVPYRREKSPSPRVFKLSTTTYGFGYDSINDDYKVLRIEKFYMSKDYSGFEYETMVYSVKRNSWNKTQDLPYYDKDLPYYYNLSALEYSGVLVGHALHWLARVRFSSSMRSYTIIAFDVITEEYNEVPLLEGMHSPNMGILGGCLCVMTHGYQAGIWVMKNYMVNKSWIKQIQVPVPYKTRFLWPKAYSESGYKILLIDGHGKLMWHDLIEKKIKEIKIPGLPFCFMNGICLGSLIPPSAKKPQVQDENKMIRNS